MSEDKTVAVYQKILGANRIIHEVNSGFKQHGISLFVNAAQRFLSIVEDISRDHRDNLRSQGMTDIINVVSLLSTQYGLVSGSGVADVHVSAKDRCRIVTALREVLDEIIGHSTVEGTDPVMYYEKFEYKGYRVTVTKDDDLYCIRDFTPADTDTGREACTYTVWEESLDKARAHYHRAVANSLLATCSE